MYIVLGASEIAANLYCNYLQLYWEGCVICSIYLRYYMKHSVHITGITLIIIYLSRLSLCFLLPSAVLWTVSLDSHICNWPYPDPNFLNRIRIRNMAHYCVIPKMLRAKSSICSINILYENRVCHWNTLIRVRPTE